MLFCMQTSIRVGVPNRDRLTRGAAEGFGGVSLDEALGRLLEEHWERMAIAAVHATGDVDWQRYVRDADRADQRDAALAADPWEGPVPDVHGAPWRTEISGPRG